MSTGKCEVGDLAAKKKKIYVAVLSHSATMTAASVANQKSVTLNNMEGAKRRHLADTSQDVIQRRTGKKEYLATN